MVKDIALVIKRMFGRVLATWLSKWFTSMALAGLIVLPRVNGGASGQTFTRIAQGPVATDLTDTSGASWVDYDGDGDLDLFLSNRRTNSLNPFNILYQNDGTGDFVRVAAGALTANGSIGHCWADYDNDGDLDVFAAGGSGAVALYRNDGAGAFSVATQVLTSSSDLRYWTCAWADYDNNGHVDLLAVHPAGFLGTPALRNALFRNDGGGQFQSVSALPFLTASAPFTVGTWSDYDQDGDMDLFIGSGPVNTAARDFLYRNQLEETGAPGFERISEAPLGSDRVDGQVWNWIDYDNDSDLDAYQTNYSGGGGGGMANNLYRNDDGVYARVTSGDIVTDKGFSLANTWGDFDNDGDLDAFVANDAPPGSNRFYRNDGAGVFTPIAQPFLDDVSRSWSATAGDYDADGDLDLFVGNISDSQSPSRNLLYRNDLSNGNHWLKVNLEGVESNRSAIGARIRVKASIGGVTVWQIRDVSSQNTFCGHNAFEVHVGLGDAAVVDALQIEWPSGVMDLYEDIAVDQSLVAVEARGVSATMNGRASGLPRHFDLFQNYPNPFSHETRIPFELSQSAIVNFSVFDLLGRQVAAIEERTYLPGHHEIRFEVGNLPAGVYAYRLHIGAHNRTRVLQILK